MKTEWDYTALAAAYVKRPDYAPAAIDAIVARAGVPRGAAVCDVGAGAGHLTYMLAARGLRVTAVEPNDAMRANGVTRTAGDDAVTWHEGTGEATGQPDGAFALVTFGSSFNVTDRQAALAETARILGTHGWFACLWNHRELDDPIQAGIEAIIKERVAGYAYGTRREDQTETIAASGLFGPAATLEGRVIHTQSVDDCIEAWRSHGTLQRQAGERFPAVVEAIAAYVRGLGTATIPVPYVTRAWIAQRRA